MTTPRILSIGKASQDVFLTAHKDIKPFVHKGVQYEQLPLGKKIHVDDLVITTGGNATNAATTFARQGLHSKYAWTLGTDIVSQTITTALDEEGIDMSAVKYEPHFHASYSTIMLAPTGERTVLNYVGSLPDKHTTPFDLKSIQDSDWLYLSSINDMELLDKIATTASKSNVKIMMNPSGLELAENSKLS